MFIINEAAANNPACQAAMASYLRQLQAEETYRQAVREGRLPAESWGTWDISDRD